MHVPGNTSVNKLLPTLYATLVSKAVKPYEAGWGIARSQALLSFLLLALTIETTDPNPDRVHAVCVCDTADLFYQHIESQLEAFGLTEDTQGRPIKARDLVDIVDGYKGLGYGKSTEEELGEKVE